MYYAVAQGSSSDTVTCTWGAAQNSLAVMVQVYSGVDPNSPLDATASGNVQGGTSLQTNPFSTASASEVMVAGMMSSGCNPPPTAGSGYILELNATPSVCGGPVAAAEDAIVSVRQTNVSASMTVPSGTYADMIVATFRAAP
jgi:hypothetical protein